MKRLLLLICTLLCANVLLAQRFWEGDLRYEITGAGKVSVYDCNQSATSVNIPSSVTKTWTHEEWSYYDDDYITITDSVRTYSVTSIRYTAFEDCSSLTSVTIGNSVTSIGRETFYNCSSLTSVTIGNSVTSIGEYAFYNCSSLTSVNIPNSVTSIGNHSFQYCYDLTSVTIGNSVTSIGEGAFMYCSSLTSVTIGNSVTSIGNSAFGLCSSLTSVDIPNSVTTIEDAAFYWCINLNSVTIGNSVTSIGDYAFGKCVSLTSVNIPNSVTSIGNSAFYNCDDLTSVNIPNSVTSIGREAFHYCTGLESINLSDNITSIGRNCFDSCINLTTVNIPTSLSVIDTSLFRYCTSLTSVNIPNSVTSIGIYAFYNCSGLTSVTIPNSVTSIGGAAFAGCSSLTSITIPNSVTSIGGSAFSSCSSLTSVTIGNSVTTIGNYAFDDCSSLTSITIPNSVTSIGSWAFSNCSSLTSVDIPNSVTSIGSGAFSDCSSLTSVTLPENITFIGDYTFLNCSSLTSITIPNSVTYIGDYYGWVFQGCASLTSITIPNSVTYIGDCAFRYCSSLTSVTIGNSVTYIGESAFSGCSSLTTLNYNAINCNGFYYSTFPNSITTINIGNSVQRIPNYFARYLNSLTSITIPNSVTSIGSSAFYNCSSLNSITCLADIPPALGNNVFNNTPSNKILYVNCGLKDDYISSWGDYFNSNNIQEIYQYNVVATINNEAFGYVSVENNCYTATLTATANNCYQFVSWNDGNTENPRTINLVTDTSFTALFEEIEFNTPISATICQGQVYNENGFNVSETGVYTQTLTSVNGCDSIVTLSLNVLPIFNTELSATICQGQVYNENGFNVSEAGVYTQTLTSANGCDSIVTLTLNVNPIFNTELTATICQGQVYNENGFNVSEAGVYTQTLTSVNGCDSIVTLSLNVNPTFNTELSATICQGQVYNENGFNVSEAGVYTQTLTSANGCDSIVTLTLNINPTFNTELSATICQGQVYTENGFNVSEAGVYTQTLTSANGCDSVVTLTLNVNPTFNTELSANICQGQVYTENGFNVSEAGVYTQTLTSVNGCDSVVTLTVSVNPTFDTTINATINAGETYSEFGFNESEAGTYVQNLQTVNGCDSTITLILDVNSSLLDVEQTEISFYPNPTDSKITFSSTIESIEVIDLTGRCVLTFSNAKTINIESLPAGAYYLRLRNNDKAIMRKVIKE